MAIDADLAQLLRGDLAGAAVTEKKMFGGLCFLVGGHMVAGTMKASALFRVGKLNDAAALAIPGTYPMQQRGRVMAGFVELPTALCADDARRATLSAMALAHAQGLPPK
jgi:TfoX/Sxy family transcriptional regulator of competence genes